MSVGSSSPTIASSSASTRTQTASSGDVVATLSYTERASRYTDLRIKIVAAGVTVRDDPVPCGAPPDFHCLGPSGTRPEPSPLHTGSRQSITVASVDDDPEPEVIADFFTGGVYCCIFSVVYDATAGGGYARTVLPWGSRGYRLKDVGGTTTREFASSDYRFDGVFCAHVCSAYPVQVWRFQGGAFVDVTRGFRKLIERDAHRHWRAFRRLRKRTTNDVKGVLAAYAADEYLLARQRLAERRLRRARRAGYLDRGGVPRSAVYLKRLRAFLRAKGYAHASRARSAEAYFEHAARADDRLECSRDFARFAIVSSSFGSSIWKRLRRFVNVGAGPILGFRIWKLICRDVTRDGRREMIAVLTCCTAATPTPWAIFRRGKTRWRPIFQVVSRKVSLSDLTVDANGDVIEKLPIFRPGDAICCPSAFSYRVTRWDGRRFVVRPLNP
jgi:hypothetical protein